MEEESFELRVKRLFGSHLFDKVPTSSFPASSWSVAAGEVESEKWNRPSGEGQGGEDGESAYAGDRADTPCSSAFYGPDGCLKKRNRRGNPRIDQDDEDEDVEEVDDEKEDVDNGGDDEERDVRSSIGLDSTLDQEEEEDENDRAAFCMDQAVDRVYMNQVMDHGPHISIHSVVPEIYDDDFAPAFNRDPRADISAAVKRLDQDNSAKIKRNITQNENNINININNNKNNNLIKPILKRKNLQDSEKPKKRVRFGTEVKQEEDSNDVPVQIPVPVTQTGVPDYIKNPSKYTKYTFDDNNSSNDEEMNKTAFQDFQNLINKNNNNNNNNEVPNFELPAKVTFNPRKKLLSESDSDAMPVDAGPTNNNNNIINNNKLCFDDINESCDMDEDMNEDKDIDMKKMDRKYRSKGDFDASF